MNDIENQFPDKEYSNSSKNDMSFIRSPLRCNLTAEFTPPSKRKVVYGDRFIPSQARRVLNFDVLANCDKKPNKKSKKCTKCEKKCNFGDLINEYSSIHEKQFEKIYKTVLQNELSDNRIENLSSNQLSRDFLMESTERMLHFSYKESNESQPSLFTTSPGMSYSPSNQKLLRSDLQQYRKVPKHPFKVLDAPGLPNDYYLNLLDWSSTDVVSVALGSKVYLWEFKSSKVTNLMESVDMDSHIACVKWSKNNPNILAFTTNGGTMFIYDVNEDKCIHRRHSLCSQRIGCIDWNNNLITTGCRDGVIRNLDIRSGQITSKSDEVHGHNLEVCGLKWDPSGKILASGGNDNKVFLWSENEKFPLTCLVGHQGAVKALSWSPHESGVLASGGGSADRCIKFWNTHSYQLSKSIDTQSQVCNLQWSLKENEIVSSHGFSSNAINIWCYPSMEKLASLKGHSSRVVYMSSSPDGEKIVTGSSDETLRFWNVFSQKNPYPNKFNFYDKFATIR